MAAGRGFSLLLFSAALLIGLASGSPFISACFRGAPDLRGGACCRPRREKAPYVAKAEKLKAEYTKKIDAYNNQQAEASVDSDKSKSDINDEEDGSVVSPMDG